MQVDAVIERLKSKTTGLRSIDGAAELAALMAANALPQQQGVSAFVIPTGLRGGEVTSASGLFVQNLEESVSILLTLRNADRTGEKAMTDIGPVIAGVLEALCGWGPDTIPGVFRLARAGAVGLAKGTFTYLIELSVMDQLRITP